MKFSILSVGRSPGATYLLILLVTFLFSLWLSPRVDFTMDEFLVYHALACSTQSCGELWNRGRERRRNLLIQIYLILGIFVLGAFIWFTSIDRNGAPLYYGILGTARRSPSGPTSFLISACAHFFKDLYVYFLNPLLTARHAQHVISNSYAEGIGLILLAAIFFVSRWASSLSREYKLFSVFCLVAFFLGLVSIASVSRSWGMHHLTPVLPLLIVAIFSLLRSRRMGRLQTCSEEACAVHLPKSGTAELLAPVRRQNREGRN